MATDNRQTTRVKFVGYPDGPQVLVPELGCGEPVERNQHRDFVCRSNAVIRFALTVSRVTRTATAASPPPA